jgi:hypothetical protein
MDSVVMGFERGEPVFGCVSIARSPVRVAAHGSSSAWVPSPHQLHSTQLCRQQHLNTNYSVSHDLVPTPPVLTETLRSALPSYIPSLNTLSSSLLLSFALSSQCYSSLTYKLRFFRSIILI